MDLKVTKQHTDSKRVPRPPVHAVGFHRGKRKYRMRLVALLLFLLLCLPMGFLVAAAESEPAIQTQPPPGPLDAARARAVLLRLHRTLDPAFGPAKGKRRFWVSESELNSILSVAAHGFPFLRRSRMEVTPDAIVVMLSAHLPETPLGGWLNLAISMQPSKEGLRLSSLDIGSYRLPASILLPMFTLALDIILGDRLGGKIVNGIDSVSVRHKTVVLSISLTRENRKVLMARAKERLSQVFMLGDAEDVRFYYRALDQAAGEGRLDPQGSFVSYLRMMLDLARQRSQGGDAINENRSAILALAMYCGHWRIANLIGAVLTDEMKGRESLCGDVTLGGRADLRRHFIVSAALQIASESGLAFAAGEFKELLDSNWRGSGFSFADLAADRAGIRFAERALSGRDDAVALQTMLSERGVEGAIFPHTSDLPEGLSEATFRRRFGDVNSPAYRDVLEIIDKRIDGLPAYARH